jgi:hypothetical protein
MLIFVAVLSVENRKCRQKNIDYENMQQRTKNTEYKEQREQAGKI